MRSTWSRFKAPFALAVAGGTFTRSWHCKPARPGRSRSTAVPLLSEALRENRGQTGRSLPRAEHTSGCHPYIRADLCRNAIGNRQPCHRSSPLTGVPRLGYRSLGDLDRVINLEAKIANPTRAEVVSSPTDERRVVRLNERAPSMCASRSTLTTHSPTSLG